MARNNKKHRKGRSQTLSLAVIGGLGAWVYKSYSDRGPDGINGFTRNALMYLTGYDHWSGNWYVQNMKYGALPIGAGMFAHLVASRLGINRLLGRAGIPLVRI